MNREVGGKHTGLVHLKGGQGFFRAGVRKILIKALSHGETFKACRDVRRTVQIQSRNTWTVYAADVNLGNNLDKLLYASSQCPPLLCMSMHNHTCLRRCTHIPTHTHTPLLSNPAPLNMCPLEQHFGNAVCIGAFLP